MCKSWTSVSIDVGSPEESNTFQPFQNPVKNSDTVEEEVIDEEYGNHPLEKINALLQMTVMLSRKTCFCNENCCQRNLIKDITDPRNMKIIAGYISYRHIGVGCAKYVKNTCIVGVRQKELFIQGHAKTQFILALHFINMIGRKDTYV